MAWPLLILAIPSIEFVFCGRKITQRRLFWESKNFGTNRRLVEFLDAFTLPVSHGGFSFRFHQQSSYISVSPATYQSNYLLILFKNNECFDRIDLNKWYTFCFSFISVQSTDYTRELMEDRATPHICLHRQDLFDSKLYTQELEEKRPTNIPKIAKYALFGLQSRKIYTGQKKITWAAPVPNMKYGQG